jgi:hypothetical protein
MTANGGGGGGDKPWEEMTWDDVIAATKNGKYKDFEIGATKELDLGAEGIVHMQIVGIDVDDLADGSGKAPLTFISKELLNTSHRMNPARTPSSAPYEEGTGTIGGWEKSEMRTYLNTTIKPLIPQSVIENIKAVTKYSVICNPAGTRVNNIPSEDSVWVPSAHEMFDSALTQIETTGPRYSEVFSLDESRKKAVVGEMSDSVYWIRSAYNSGSFYAVKVTGGSGAYSSDNSSVHIPLGFCL